MYKENKITNKDMTPLNCENALKKDKVNLQQLIRKLKIHASQILK